MRKLLALLSLLVIPRAWSAPVPIGGPIIAYGDSITAGAFVATGSDYPTLLGGYYGQPITNYAQQGDTSCEMTDKVFTHENPTNASTGIYVSMIGTNDATTGGQGSYEPVYRACHQAALSWLGTPREQKVLAQDAACVKSGSWSADTTYPSLGEVSSTNGSSMTCSITAQGSTLYLWYRIINGNGGTFSYALDGSGVSTLANVSTPAITDINGGTHSVAVLRIPGVTPGVHHLTLTVTSSTSSSNLVSLLALGSSPASGTTGHLKVYSGGVPFQEGDGQSAVTAAYNQDALNDVALLASDGLAIYPVNVRAYLCPVCAISYPDMANTEHPNATGQQELAAAWENKIDGTYVPVVVATQQPRVIHNILTR